MRTAIIDRSLSGVKFKETVNKYDVLTYVKSLIEAGADYVEVDLHALARLPEPDGAVNYIFRIKRAEEFMIANALPFSYALLPLKYTHLISKIKIPVILEINTGDADILALLKIVSESIDFTKIALLRLIGDFNRKTTEEFTKILRGIRMKYAVPIDICPLNTTLGALSSSIAAFDAGVDSITLSFGNSSNFTPLEEFLISLATIHKFIIKKNYISGICHAAAFSSCFSEIETVNLKMLMKRYQLSPQKVEKADEAPLLRSNYYKKSKRKSLLEKKLDFLEVDEDLSAEITEKLKKYGMDFYENKGKDDFLN